ncbi:hypothetical protein C0993_004060 [Termitomyces sp. T159_Od127]|nr:hypothetical protein C0993_004060 [Termitomyces sp. T159_Od127]
MAKSIRSKSKRTHRNKKREDSVYAATEAARLHRLSSKLAAIVSKDSEGNAPAQGEEEGEDLTPGWCWFASFGLLDPSDITAEIMDTFSNGGTGRTLLLNSLVGRGRLKRHNSLL